MERHKICEMHKKNTEQIEALELANLELRRQSYLLCDEKQWFTEELETHIKGKKVETRLYGRIHFMQNFKDESTDKYFPVERTRIVRIDGEWV